MVGDIPGRLGLERQRDVLGLTRLDAADGVVQLSAAFMRESLGNFLAKDDVAGRAGPGVGDFDLEAEILADEDLIGRLDMELKHRTGAAGLSRDLGLERYGGDTPDRPFALGDEPVFKDLLFLRGQVETGPDQFPLLGRLDRRGGRHQGRPRGNLIPEGDVFGDRLSDVADNHLEGLFTADLNLFGENLLDAQFGRLRPFQRRVAGTGACGRHRLGQKRGDILQARRGIGGAGEVGDGVSLRLGRLGHCGRRVGGERIFGELAGG